MCINKIYTDSMVELRYIDLQLFNYQDYVHYIKPPLALSDKRKNEYVAARVCAQVDGLKVFDIKKDSKSGRPLFPSHVKGSLSHSKDLAVAVVSTKLDHVVSVGVDVERCVDQKKYETVKKMCLVSPEIEGLDNNSDQYEIATIMFSAKEALYKLISPLNGDVYIPFKDAKVEEIKRDEGTFIIELNNKDVDKLYNRQYKGQYFNVKNNIICLLVLSS